MTDEVNTEERAQPEIPEAQPNRLRATGPMREVMKRKRDKVLKPARYEDIDTGAKQIVQIRDLDGTLREEERPILERLFRDAIVVPEEYEEEVFVVYTEDVDGDGLEERHEFKSEEAAQNYLKGFN